MHHVILIFNLLMVYEILSLYFQLGRATTRSHVSVYVLLSGMGSTNCRILLSTCWFQVWQIMVSWRPFFYLLYFRVLGIEDWYPQFNGVLKTYRFSCPTTIYLYPIPFKLPSTLTNRLIYVVVRFVQHLNFVKWVRTFQQSWSLVFCQHQEVFLKDGSCLPYC